MSSRVWHPAQRTRRGDFRNGLDELVEPVARPLPPPPAAIPVGEAREVEPHEYLIESARECLRAHLRQR